MAIGKILRQMMFHRGHITVVHDPFGTKPLPPRSLDPIDDTMQSVYGRVSISGFLPSANLGHTHSPELSVPKHMVPFRMTEFDIQRCKLSVGICNLRQLQSRVTKAF